MKQLVRVLTDLSLELSEEVEVQRQRILELESQVLDSALQNEANKCHQQMLANCHEIIDELSTENKNLHVKYDDLHECLTELNERLVESKRDVECLSEENKELRTSILKLKSKLMGEMIAEDNISIPEVVHFRNLFTGEVTPIRTGEASISLQSGIEPTEYVNRSFEVEYDPFN